MSIFGFKRVLVLAPHTDDGELGAGGIINRLIAAGADCVYIAFSDCEESVPEGFPKDVLRKEAYKATSVLGFQEKDVTIKKYPVRNFSYHRQDILEDLIAIKREYNPDLVIAPSSYDVHQDHRTIAEEAVRAYKDRTILGYEMPWNCINFTSTLVVEITEQQLDRKLEAIGEYKSQENRGYIKQGYFKHLASIRGAEIGAQYAEAFEVVRWVVKK